MLSQQQIEQQLIAYRLSIEELKTQLKTTINTLSQINNSLTALEKTSNSLIIGSETTGDGYQAGDTIYHKMKHVFNVAIGFFGAAPATKQTLTSYTSNHQNTIYLGITNTAAGFVFAQVTDLNSLRSAYENLRTSYDDIRSKLQNTTLVG